MDDMESGTHFEPRIRALSPKGIQFLHTTEEELKRMEEKSQEELRRAAQHRRPQLLRLEALSFLRTHGMKAEAEMVKEAIIMEKHIRENQREEMASILRAEEKRKRIKRKVKKLKKRKRKIKAEEGRGREIERERKEKEASEAAKQARRQAFEEKVREAYEKDKWRQERILQKQRLRNWKQR